MFGPPPYSLVRSIAYKWFTLTYPGAPSSPIIIRGYIDVYIDYYGVYWLYCAEKDNGSISGYLQGPYASNTEAGMAAFNWICGLGFMHTSGPEGSFPAGGGYSFMGIVIQFHGTEGSWVYSWDSNTYTSIEAAEIAVNNYWGNPTQILTITKSGEGSTNPPVGTYEYPFDEAHTITITATNTVSGWTFEKWFVDGAFYDDHNPIEIFMNMDHSLTAIFVSEIPPTKKRLIIQTLGLGSTAPLAGTYEYDANTSKTITATAESGWQFEKWVKDGADAGSSLNITVTMDTDHTLCATFTLIGGGFDWLPVIGGIVVIVGVGGLGYYLWKKK
jgi:uncharacterized repeat protein (TIGR02543 family)